MAEGSPDPSTPIPPLKAVQTPEAEEGIRNLQDWLSRISEDLPGRLTDALEIAVEKLCHDVAELLARNTPMTPDEAASLYHARPIFLAVVRTQVRRRRSASGVYHLFYDLQDADGDGRLETLRVITVRHAAAKPLSIESASADE